jgi:hypothetical protein
MQEDLELLNIHIFTEEAFDRFHVDRFANQQAGKSVYVIAWLKNIPVGHAQLMSNNDTEQYPPLLRAFVV